MKVVILAGGKGSRISEITKRIPKPMIQIKKRTILEHILNIYSAQNFKEFIIAIGYKGELIKKYFKKFKIEKNQYKLMGQNKVIKILFIKTGNGTMTGGRLKYVKKYLDKKDKNFMFTYGDGLANVNLHRLKKFHLKRKKIATLTAVRPLSRYGVLDIKGDTVKNFKEKMPLKSGWINGGYFIFNFKIFRYLKNYKTVLEREPLENLARKRQLNASKHFGFWHSIDTQRDKDHLENFLKKRNKKLPWIN
tara:strand:- start:1934 stop:2680 length:747 start_codon:yes stop_codon:yes gene_type:complete